MPDLLDRAVTIAFFVAAATWVGGLVVAIVVVHSARASLSPRERVRFFQALGRRYLAILGAAGVVAVATGAWLLRDRPWDATMAALVLSIAALVVATVAGVVQARAMTRLRRRAVDFPDDPTTTGRVVTGARRAVILRAAIAGLTVAVVILGVVVAPG